MSYKLKSKIETTKNKKATSLPTIKIFVDIRFSTIIIITSIDLRCKEQQENFYLLNNKCQTDLVKTT